jgi:orotate phosphoribosyltransferase
MTTLRHHLLRLLATQSFQLGEFKLSSGGTSDYYIDCRRTTLDAEGARLTGRVVYDEIQKQRWSPRAIGGMTMGADPLVVAVASLTAQLVQVRAPARVKGQDVSEHLIHGFLVRKADKAHGTQQRIEGFRQPGARAVIVDDVCTTGASTIEAIAAARAAGFEVAGVLCLVEREEAGGRAAVERAAAPAKFVNIFTAAEVRAEHLRAKEGAGAAAAPAHQ